MKKLLITMSLAAITLAAKAQNQTTTSSSPSSTTTTTTITTTTAATTPILSKRGYAILPEAGDWGISFNAIPLLNYVGSIFNSNGNSLNYGTGNAFPSFLQNGAVTVRKFQDANTAFRGMVKFNLTTSSAQHQVQSSAAGAGVNDMVTDKATQTNSNIVIGAGIEKRKGIGRVQGIYGAMATIGKMGTGYKYSYGNTFNNGSAIYTNYVNNNINSTGSTIGSSRVTSDKGIGSIFTFGVVAFAGVEYFIAPKLSLGAEFQWGPYIGIGGKEKVTTETTTNTGGSWNTNSKTNNIIAGSSALGFTTLATSINLNFFF